MRDERAVARRGPGDAMKAQMDGAHFGSLIADMESALARLVAPAERDPLLWSRGAPGKWTTAQHVEHLALALGRSADAYEKREAWLRAGTLQPRPKRGLVQALFVGWVVGRDLMPRGARAVKVMRPIDQPEQAATLERLRRDAARHRALGGRLTAAEMDQLWAPNPFRPKWHYVFPEALRMHAVHARHHARQIEEMSARRHS